MALAVCQQVRRPHEVHELLIHNPAADVGEAFGFEEQAAADEVCVVPYSDGGGVRSADEPGGVGVQRENGRLRDSLLGIFDGDNRDDKGGRAGREVGRAGKELIIGPVCGGAAHRIGERQRIAGIAGTLDGERAVTPAGQRSQGHGRGQSEDREIGRRVGGEAEEANIIHANNAGRAAGVVAEIEPELDRAGDIAESRAGKGVGHEGKGGRAAAIDGEACQVAGKAIQAAAHRQRSGQGIGGCEIELSGEAGEMQHQAGLRPEGEAEVIVGGDRAGLTVGEDAGARVKSRRGRDVAARAVAVGVGDDAAITELAEAGGGGGVGGPQVVGVRDCRHSDRRQGGGAVVGFVEVIPGQRSGIGCGSGRGCGQQDKESAPTAAPLESIANDDRQRSAATARQHASNCFHGGYLGYGCLPTLFFCPRHCNKSLAFPSRSR